MMPRFSSIGSWASIRRTSASACLRIERSSRVSRRSPMPSALRALSLALQIFVTSESRNKGLALQYLTQSFDLDPNYRDMVADEPDFDPIRDDPPLFCEVTSSRARASARAAAASPRR